MPYFNREKLRVQEEALKKQIESYDTLIERTKSELLLEQSNASGTSEGGHYFTQPQIKSPKQQVAATAAQHLSESPPPPPTTHAAAVSSSPEVAQTDLKDDRYVIRLTFLYWLSSVFFFRHFFPGTNNHSPRI